MKVWIVALSFLATVTSNFAFVVRTPSFATTKASYSTSSALQVGGLKNWQEDTAKEPMVASNSKISSSLASDAVVQKVNHERRPGSPVVKAILDPSYFVTYLIAAVGPAVSSLYPPELDGSPSIIGTMGNCFHLVLAALLWVQTSRVRCVFEDDGVEFYNVRGQGLDLAEDGHLERKPGNFVVGGDNRWLYDKITGYQFFPSVAIPIICVMKETQTGEGKAYYGTAQPHFFPSLFDARAFQWEMDKRGVKYGVF